MPITKREVQVLLCDGCGIEKAVNMGTQVPGVFISALEVRDDYTTVIAEIYACSVECLPEGVLGGLFRAGLSEELHVKAIASLRARPEARDPALSILDDEITFNMPQVDRSGRTFHASS